MAREAPKGPLSHSQVRARIRAVGFGYRHSTLDAVEAEARRLAELASPHTGHFTVDELDRDQLRAIDQIVQAVDTWTTWANGRPAEASSRTTKAQQPKALVDRRIAGILYRR